MKVAVSGRITRAVLDNADLIGGFTPTVLLVNDVQPQPNVGLPLEVMPICRMLDEDAAVRQRNYSLCQAAEAAIITDENEHLARIARSYGLPVYEE